ncbi:MAG: hypothetical protein ACRCVK_17310, partial [Aeromonas veronii]
QAWGGWEQTTSWSVLAKSDFFLRHLILVLYLCQVEPQVSLQDDQTGHRSSNGLGGGLCGLQGQVRGAAEVAKGWRVYTRLVQGAEEFGLEDLEYRHRVER